MADEQKPPSRNAKKRSAVASAATGSCLSADIFDSGRCGFEPSLISVKTPVSLKVGGGGQENPCHLLEARLRKALLAAVLEEPLTLDGIRRDLVEDDVRSLPE
jgi:hypothetical protein